MLFGTLQKKSGGQNQLFGEKVASLLKELQSDDSSVRQRAAEGLLRAETYDFKTKGVSEDDQREAALALVLRAKDEIAEVRAAVAYCLGCLGGQPIDSISVLSELIADKNDNVACNALWAAGEVKYRDSDVVRAIVERHQDKSRDIRFRVAWALAQLSLPNNDVHSAIDKLVRDRDSTVRMYAIEACSNCDHPRIQKLVKRALSDRAGEVRGAGCRAIGSNDLPWDRHKKRLLSLAKRDHHGVKLEAVHALITRWPVLTKNPDIRSWMLANTGYWWVEDALERQG
ncbi:MAG: hypothetical protein HKN18_06660 [Silicimonas sp.]|nr:hypothetical protein [Silicimonas sp.]